MRRAVLSLAVLGIIACEKKDAAPVADSSAMETPPATTMNLASMAGTWNMEVLPEGRDTVILTYVLTATGNTAGWTQTFPGRDPIPFRIVSVAGDSLIAETGPYESALRPGVQVSTWSVGRLKGDSMIASVVATYASGADSVIRLRARGTKAP